MIDRSTRGRRRFRRHDRGRRHHCARAGVRGGAWARAGAGVRRSPRPPSRSRQGGRGDDRIRDSGCCGRRLLRDPGDAQHGPRGRFGRRAGGADRAGTRGRGDPDRVHGVDLEGPPGRGAHRDGRARAAGSSRLHRRRPSGRLGGPDAPRAPVQRRDRRMLALHEEEPTLSRDGQMHEGAVSAALGLAGWPAVAESRDDRA